jgi:hypothetical protein
MMSRELRFVAQSGKKEAKALNDETKCHDRQTTSLPGQERALRRKKYSWVRRTGHEERDYIR